MAFRISKPHNGSSLLEIKDFPNIYTVLCVRTDAADSSKVKFNLFAYPGDSKSITNRGFRYIGASGTQFNPSTNQSSRYECKQADADQAIRDGNLISEAADGAFLPNELKGVFCCHAIHQKTQQPSATCAVMTISSVSYSSLTYCINFTSRNIAATNAKLSLIF